MAARVFRWFAITVLVLTGCGDSKAAKGPWQLRPDGFDRVVLPRVTHAWLPKHGLVLPASGYLCRVRGGIVEGPDWLVIADSLHEPEQKIAMRLEESLTGDPRVSSDRRLNVPYVINADVQAQWHAVTTLMAGATWSHVRPSGFLLMARTWDSEEETFLPLRRGSPPVEGSLAIDIRVDAEDYPAECVVEVDGQEHRFPALNDYSDPSIIERANKVLLAIHAQLGDAFAERKPLEIVLHERATVALMVTLADFAREAGASSIWVTDRWWVLDGASTEFQLSE